MNKFQRLATQVAKDDSKKEFNRNREKFSLKADKALTLAAFKEEKRTYEDARRYKNWNKSICI